MKHSYVIICTVRDEIGTIERHVQSILQQTVQPTLWVIYDDGSTDGTQDVLREISRKHARIQLIAKARSGPRKTGAHLARVLHDALKQVEELSWDFWFKVDADVTLEPDYIEELLHCFSRDPRLGMASGKAFIPRGDGSYRSEWCPDHHVLGFARVYRRSCWRDVGGFVEQRHWDVVDVYTAQMCGWMTTSFSDLKVIHHRAIDAAMPAPARRRFDSGRAHFLVGYHPLYFLARCARGAVDEKPYFLSGLFMAMGYGYAAMTCRPTVDPELVKFIRKKQASLLRPSLFLRYLRNRTKVLAE